MPEVIFETINIIHLVTIGITGYTRISKKYRSYRCCEDAKYDDPYSITPSVSKM